MAADAKGFTDCVREFGGGGVDDLAVDFVCVATIIAKGAADFGEILVQSNRVGFAVVPGLDCSKNFSVGVNEVGELDHHVPSVCRCHVTPGGVLECLASGSDRDID